MGTLLFFLKKIIIRVLSVLNAIANRSQVTCVGNVTFGHKSKVYNIQKNAEKITINDCSHIKGELTVYKHGGEIHIGKYCFVGENTRIWSAKKITIGHNVLIAHNVDIHDCNDHPINPELRHQHYKSMMLTGHPDNIDLAEKEIIIEDNVWIGFGAAIMKGVAIGEGAIVGAHAVVTKDVPPYTTVVGNPARVIKSLIKENE